MKISTALYIIMALLFIVGIIVKNRYVIAAGFMIAAIYFAVDLVITRKKK